MHYVHAMWSNNTKNNVTIWPRFTCLYFVKHIFVYCFVCVLICFRFCFLSTNRQISRQDHLQQWPISCQCDIKTYVFLYPPSQQNETDGDYVFNFVCLCTLNPIGLNGCNAEKCIWLVREKLKIFPYGQYIVRNVVLLNFWWYSQVQDPTGVSEKCTKM